MDAPGLSVSADLGVLVDVEMNVSVQFGYQVATEAVFQRGIARIGQPHGLQLWRDAAFRIAEPSDYTTRFTEAYDVAAASHDENAPGSLMPSWRIWPFLSSR